MSHTMSTLTNSPLRNDSPTPNAAIKSKACRVSSSVQTGELDIKDRENTCIRTVPIRRPKAAPVPIRQSAMMNAYNLAENTLTSPSEKVRSRLSDRTGRNHFAKRFSTIGRISSDTFARTASFAFWAKACVSTSTKVMPLSCSSCVKRCSSAENSSRS